VFRFTHRNHETWEGDRLVAIETTTDDDGKPLSCTASGWATRCASAPPSATTTRRAA